MRNTLRTIAFGSALCLGLTTGSALFAQDTTTTPGGGQQGSYAGHGHGPMSPDQELSHLTKALSLSSDQQTQIKPILQDRQDQMMQLHQDSSLSRDAKMTKMKSLDDDSNTKLEAVLNDQQKTKYEQMIADRKAKMQARRAQGGDSGSSNGGGAQPQ